jgi:hypothetical protein
MDQIKSLVSLRDYCRNNRWPRLSQWHHWIYSENQIAKVCVKKIGGRYMLDTDALAQYIEKASLHEV